MDDFLPKVGGATVFSKLDALSRFWKKIPLAKESAKLTIFIIPFGIFCFQRSSFGIPSAPESFQRKITELLTNTNGVVGFHG